MNVVRKVLDIGLYAAPVGVPTILMVTGRVGYRRLASEKIALMFPESLRVGALADVVCFDKTGTLTYSVVGADCITVGTWLAPLLILWWVLTTLLPAYGWHTAASSICSCMCYQHSLA